MDMPKKLKHKMAIASRKGGAGRSVALVKRTGRRTPEGELIYQLIHASGLVGNGEYTRDELARTCVAVPDEWQEKAQAKIDQAYREYRASRSVKPFPEHLKKGAKKEEDEADAATVQSSDGQEARARQLLGIG